jgi:hypothetical protein
MFIACIVHVKILRRVNREGWNGRTFYDVYVQYLVGKLLRQETTLKT